MFANTGTAAAAWWRKLGCTQGDTAASSATAEGASTISSPCKEDQGSRGDQGEGEGGKGRGEGGGGRRGLLRNGKKASSFPGPRPNFLQKSFTLQTSDLLQQEAGAGGSLFVAPKTAAEGAKTLVDPAGTRRAACTQAHTITSTTSAAGSKGRAEGPWWLLRAASSKATHHPKGTRGADRLWGCTGTRGPPGCPKDTGVSEGCWGLHYLRVRWGSSQQCDGNEAKQGGGDRRWWDKLARRAGDEPSAVRRLGPWAHRACSQSGITTGSASIQQPRLKPGRDAEEPDARRHPGMCWCCFARQEAGEAASARRAEPWSQGTSGEFSSWLGDMRAVAAAVVAVGEQQLCWWHGMSVGPCRTMPASPRDCRVHGDAKRKQRSWSTGG